MALDAKNEAGGMERLKQVAQTLRRQEEMKKSLQAARQRQRRMLPEIPLVPGFEFSALYIPAANVSGDFYDFFKLDGDLIGLVIGDVSGHGLEAAILMGMAKKALQIYARGRDDPREVLSLTNGDLGRDLDESTFLSASYAILDTRTRTLRLARAGHNPALLVNPARTPPLTLLQPQGMVIGVDKTGKRFPQSLQEQSLTLQSGDLLFKYTDGLVEAPNRQKQEFGEEQLKDLLLKYWKCGVSDLLNLIEESIITHVGAMEQEDDITMIACKVLD